MSDYQRFLGAGGQATLPYFGGPFVAAEDRRLRLAEPVEPGFWRFEISGRTARAVRPAEPPDLSHLRAVRGHFTAGYVVHHAGRAERLALRPAAQPARFAPVVGRRWPSGPLLLDVLDFEGETEEAARQAYEERRPLGDLKGAPASLRAAYGYAVVIRAAGELDLAVAPAEVRTRVGEIAAEGDPAAERVLRELAAERARRQAEALASPRRPAPRPARQRADPAERAATALHAAGASLLDLRILDGGLMEVRYAFAGERFVSVVQAATLQVIDAGICLAGHDWELTLESLPSAIREAMDGGELYVTSHG